jgi:hypothetical protein
MVQMIRKIVGRLWWKKVKKSYRARDEWSELE